MADISVKTTGTDSSAAEPPTTDQARVMARFAECVRAETDGDVVRVPVGDLRVALDAMHRLNSLEEIPDDEVERAARLLKPTAWGDEWLNVSEQEAAQEYARGTVRLVLKTVLSGPVTAPAVEGDVRWIDGRPLRVPQPREGTILKDRHQHFWRVNRTRIVNLTPREKMLDGEYGFVQWYAMQLLNLGPLVVVRDGKKNWLTDDRPPGAW